MIRIEDNYEDVLQKAVKGQDLSIEILSEKTNFTKEKIATLLAGDYSEQAARALSQRLNLKFSGVHKLATGNYTPPDSKSNLIHQINTPAPVSGYEEMTVNAYILDIPESNRSIIFDTGITPEAIIAKLNSLKRQPVAIFLTHGHFDHIDGLNELLSFFPDLPVYSSSIAGTKTTENETIHFGDTKVRCLSTPGHSSDGMSFHIEGPSVEYCIVGDAIFAGSVGGIRKDYSGTLENIQRKILSLPEHTILCPGHGPLTTVDYEKSYNPFF